MQEAKLVSKNITDFWMRMKPDLQQIPINVELSVGFGLPKDGSTSAGMMNVRIEVKAEKPEDYHVLFIEFLEYRFIESQDDIQKALEETFNELTVQEVSDDLDKAMEAIGKPPLKIKESYNQ